LGRKWQKNFVGGKCKREKQIPFGDDNKKDTANATATANADVQMAIEMAERRAISAGLN
jgi:hypothetical protein